MASVDGAVHLDISGQQPDVPVTTPPIPEPDVTEPPDLPEAPVVEGEVGTPCEEDEDCFSGWCVPSPEGKVCSKTCLDDCPDGFECQSMTAPNGSPVFVCIHPRASLCLPCLENKDCNQTIAGEGNECLSWGEEGSFCGASCDEDDPCPSGYGCEEMEDSDGDITWQCLPEEGLCDCGPLGAQIQAMTTCSQTNDVGVCLAPRFCDFSGLAACEAPEAVEEDCDGVDDDCDGATDENTGGDLCTHEWEGGSCEGLTTCQDGALVCTAPTPEAEACNGLDDDCDGALDEDFPDTDADGTADCLDLDDDGDGSPDEEDCEPLVATTYPGAPEVCNGVDDDCDDHTDEENAEGCQPYYLDLDQDTYGDGDKATACLCGVNPVTYHTTQVAGDCDDLVPTTYPGAPEPCNGVDDDCNQLVDDNDADEDQDGISDCLDNDDDGDGFDDFEDCAPNDPEIYPGAEEVCDGIDTNCNGALDEENSVGCAYYLKDADGDGQGNPNVDPRCLCTPESATGYTASLSGDCDDLNPNVYAGAEEVCNGINDDCDAFVDEGSVDTDGDGIADCVDEDDDNDGSPDDEDCQPLNPEASAAAEEVCGNGKDDDCDSLVDEQDGVGCTMFWRDLDGDGVGSDNHPELCLCGPDPELGYVVDGPGDCDDLDPGQNPSASETCNLEDDNCNTVVDEGVTSPCGDCASVCWADLGPGGILTFDEVVTVGLNSNAQQELVLGSTPGSGFVRHTFQGWQQGSTLWDFISIQATGLTGVSWLTIRYRGADTVVDLANTPWTDGPGTFPPESFPVYAEITADLFELEVTLHSAQNGVSPALLSVAVIAYEL